MTPDNTSAAAMNTLPQGQSLLHRTFPVYTTPLSTPTYPMKPNPFAVLEANQGFPITPDRRVNGPYYPSQHGSALLVLLSHLLSRGGRSTGGDRVVFTRPQCAQTAKMPGLAWTTGRSGYPSIAEPNTSREEQEGFELRYWGVGS